MIILGLSGGYKHDAGACIVIDGKLVAYHEEERFSKTKHAIGLLPICSILNCIDDANIDLQDIDIIATSWKTSRTDVVKDIFEHPALAFRKKTPVVKFNHHLAHAASGFYTSGFKEALIIVVDGSGDSVSTSISHAKNGEFKILRNYDISQSLGYFYSAVGLYLGFNMWEEGKLMGLASYGEVKYDFPVQITEDGYEFPITSPDDPDITKGMMRKWLYLLTKHLGSQPDKKYFIDKMGGRVAKQFVDFTQEQKDIAASAQHTLEQIILNMVRYYVNDTGCRNLVIAGGVALNCSANGKVERSGLVDDVYIIPSPNDSGASIGAAMLASAQHEKPQVLRLISPYWGAEFSNSEIMEFLNSNQIPYEFVDDISEKVARQVADNKVVGWFQGRGEMGPRALGNRSIIANPITEASRDRVNKEVKYREEWRPLAPSILDERRGWLIQEDSYSPYMLKAYKVQEIANDVAAAIVHIDQTTRPQTVRKQDNELWYRVIAEFEKLTGVPAVLNTSLNVQGKPICGTPLDAIHTFYGCGMDLLAMGNFLIRK